MLKRIYAVFVARNREFVRDRGTLAWNILMPVILVFGLAFVFGGEGRNQYTVGVLQSSTEIDAGEHPFLESRFIEFVPVSDEADGFRKVERHRLDLLVRFRDERRYWVNPESPRGYFAERLLLQSDAAAGGRMQKAQISGDPIRYVDWVLPGILGMNMMFSCLFGVGYVVVRYRKNGFLKRLRATPLRPHEFIMAQVASRLLLVLIVTTFVYFATHLILDTRMDGSYMTLLLVTVVGCISMVSLGGWRPVEHDFLADDDPVRSMVFAGRCRAGRAGARKSFPAYSCPEFRTCGHARRGYTARHCTEHDHADTIKPGFFGPRSLLLPLGPGLTSWNIP
jgi:hypothetical protein